MTLPKGLYDLLITPEVKASLPPPPTTITTRELGTLERRLRLVADLSARLAAVLEDIDSADDAAHHELATINRLLAEMRSAQPDWSLPVECLTGVDVEQATPPATGLHHPWLFAAGKGDPSLLGELRAELSACDHVDIIVSFITWSGIRRLMDLLQASTAVDAAGIPRTRLRVLTTTYTGATEERALTWLARLPGVEVKVSLDGRRTRLHAKAWLFRRESGFGSAYVGSANLSGAALTGGLEWTIKITQAAQRDIFEKSVAHFETLWADPEFQTYDPDNSAHVEQLKSALSRERMGSSDNSSVTTALTTWFDIEAKPFQQAILDRLAHERAHGRHRNLVVAATGTGKTVIAALDYRRIAQQDGGQPRLLFVAHREEILQQALNTFRQVLRDPTFGDILAGGNDPQDLQHIFTTIQSANSRRLAERFGGDYWRVAVIDECHHIAADSFKGFLQALAPKYLLGLTATPERGDGESIMPFFDSRPDGSPAAELRLWDALDQQLLSPFEYYGIHDATDFSRVSWGKSVLEKHEINVIVLGSQQRARLIADALAKYVDDLDKMRALGFCVTVAHARMMADYFQRHGIPSAIAHGDLSPTERSALRRRLESGEIRMIFSCDLYNEGIDLPFVNTILLLRPTDSPVIFAQQLGRGLRLSPGKQSCLVLDFVGQFGTSYRFDRLWRSIACMSRSELFTSVEHGFGSLPPGCVVQFDKKSREVVLANLRAATAQRWSQLVNELRAYHQIKRGDGYSIAEFVNDQHIDLGDLYRSKAPSGWTQLRISSGLLDKALDAEGEAIAKRLFALLHANDPLYLAFLEQLREHCDAPAPEHTQRRLSMLAYQLFPGRTAQLDAFISSLRNNEELFSEISSLASLLLDNSDIAGDPLAGAPADWLLAQFGRYSRAEILAAIGVHRDGQRKENREGLLRLKDQRTELLFVTLDKSEGFHQDISYRDYAVSPGEFHWETQNSAGPDTASGRQYLESPGNGWRYYLFVRKTPDDPFHALGEVTQKRISGSKPMSVVWALRQPMPVSLFREFSVLRG